MARIEECDFPYLFSPESGRCKHYSVVSCGQRFEPKTHCTLSTEECGVRWLWSWGGGGVKIKLLVFLAEHLKEHYSFKMFLIMENHNFMINYVVKNFIHFCGNISDRRFGDVLAFEKIAEKSDKYTEYIYRY